MEQKMETTIMGYTGITGVYTGYILIGMMEKKMETTTIGI